MTLTLIRHGSVNSSYKGHYNGDNHVRLDYNAKAELHHTDKKLQYNDYNLILSSPIYRAQCSAKLLKLTKPFFLDSRLKEKSWGWAEGLSYDEIVSLKGVEYQNFNQWMQHLGGEPLYVFENRLLSFINDLLTYKQPKILCITHAGVIRYFYALKFSLTYEESFRFKIPPTSMHIFKITPHFLTQRNKSAIMPKNLR